MSATSDLTSTTAWPAARPTGINPIQHPAWEAARNFILDLAAEGPVTAIIVGEPGTGKTWLLRELASALGEHGFPTMLLLQGDLPMALSSGAALLVDQASLMSPAMRRELSAQQHGVVVLAGAEWVDDELDSASPGPVLVRLRPLDPDEIADFADEWLRRAGAPAILDDATLSRLADQSGGRAGPLVKVLAEAVATTRRAPVAPPAAITPPEPPFAQAAMLPQAAPAPLPVAPPRPRRRVLRPVLLASAVAAAVVLAWALRPVPPPAVAQAPAAPPVPAVADATPPPLPPVQRADTSEPARPAMAPPAPSPVAEATPSPVATPNQSVMAEAAPAPVQPSPSNPTLVVPPPPPELDSTPAPPAPAATTLAPAIAEAPVPPVLSPADPTVVATLTEPASTTAPDPPRPAPRIGGPGLVLVAQRGDTLERLYGSVYRDRRAPPFATVLAANPAPLKPGAIVVFPEPPGGWQRVQR